MFENVLTSVQLLSDVKDQADQHFTHTCIHLDYDQCATLLLSAETNYDAQFNSSSARRSRKVYNTELGGSGFELDSPSEVAKDLDYDIYASATTLLANITNRGNSNSYSYLPSEDYTSLTPEAKDLWIKYLLI